MSQGPVKKHECLRCGRKFARREHLERHERSHTKEQPFACSICPQAFTRKDLLNRHWRVYHHQQQDQVTLELRAEQDPAPAQVSLLPAADSGQGPPTGDLLIPDNAFLVQPNTAAFTNSTPRLHLPGQDQDADMFSSMSWDDIAFPDGFTLPFFPYSPSEQRQPGIRGHELLEPTTQNSLRIFHPDTLSRFGSRLPSLEPENPPPKKPRVVSSSNASASHPRMSAACLERFKLQIRDFQHLIHKDFALPTRHAFNRFVHGYFSGFHGHYPMFHVPTLSLENLPVELMLCIAAIGAQYCLERTTGFKLFYAAKSIAHERLRRKDFTHRNGIENGGEHSLSEVTSCLNAVQTFILMIAVSMWSETNPPFHEALAIRSILERLMQRDLSGNALLASISESWQDWILHESIVRARVIGFCFFNLQTIVFDVPPMLLVNDMRLSMPCSEREWEAGTVEGWRTLYQVQHEEVDFKQCFRGLFDAQNSIRNEPNISFSPLGSHGLIHALIQRLWLLHQAADLPTQELPQSNVLQVERALKRWRLGWENHEEASATPLHGHGPMSFTSAALLRLAYIRINMEAGTVPRSLSSWDPQRVARDFNSMPPIRRSPRATRAALHCAHGLSVIVKFGIEVFARTQLFFLSNQYALCSLESALFLTKWLEGVTGANHDTALATEETQLLDFIMDCIAETEYAADPQLLVAGEKRLGTIITRLWAKIFRSDSIWEIVGLIGRSLEAYADLMETAA